VKKNFLTWLLFFIIGALAILGFAPFNLWFCTPFSFVLLLCKIKNKKARQASGISFAWGLGFYLAGINWIFVPLNTFGQLPIVGSLALMGLLMSYLALYPALFAYGLSRFIPQKNTGIWIIAVPIIWFLTEGIRGSLLTGFPWLLLGYSQTDGPLHSLAPLIGVRGISFVLCLISAALAQILLTLRQPKLAWKPLLIVFLPFIISLLLENKLWTRLQPNRATSLALIQGNTPQEKKWIPSERWPIINQYSQLTAENWGKDLIIWPEAAIPAFEMQLPHYLTDLDNLGKKHHSAIITGILDIDLKTNAYFNDVIVLGKNNVPIYNKKEIPRYTKHHLVPFGEFIPLKPLFKRLANLFNLPYSSFSRGAYQQKNLVANNRYLAVATCYEIIFSQQVNANVNAQTDFILTLSNDSWFGHSIGPLQHMQIAQMRARELQKPLIRVTNSGVTATTNAWGDITEKLPQFKTDVLTKTLIPTAGSTPFNRFGYKPLWFITVLFSLYLLIPHGKKRK